MTDWLVQAFVATSLLAGVIFAVRGPVSRAFGARAAYALWALPALRMLMPPLPGWHALYIPVWRLGPDHTTVGLVSPDDAIRLAGTLPVVPAPPPVGDVSPLVHVAGLPWMTVLVLVWLGGAVVWFGWQMLRYHGFLRHALRSATLLTNECGVDVLLTDHVDGPVAAGVIHRRIFLPRDFMTRYAPRERRLALLHEGAHHDRNDILANLAALVMLALHWWNPIAHKAYRLFRADQELACDATVLAGVGNADRHAYGSAVLKSASARMPGVACALSHKDELKRRLQVMARKPIGSPRQWLGFGIAISAIGAGLVVTASGHANVPDEPVISSAEIAQIREEADAARREGLLAAAEARRDARLARDDARHEADDARREGLETAADAQRDARHAADDARREADEARREGMRMAADARREAAVARDEGLRDAARTRREAEVARQSATWATDRASVARGEAVRQIALVRRQMVSECAAKGRTVDPSSSWDRLALCGDSASDIAQRAIAQAWSGFGSAARGHPGASATMPDSDRHDD